MSEWQILRNANFGFPSGREPNYLNTPVGSDECNSLVASGNVKYEKSTGKMKITALTSPAGGFYNKWIGNVYFLQIYFHRGIQP